MKIEIQQSELQTKKIFVATPMYVSMQAYSKAVLIWQHCVQTMVLSVDFSLYSMNHLSQEQEIIL